MKRNPTAINYNNQMLGNLTSTNVPVRARGPNRERGRSHCKFSAEKVKAFQDAKEREKQPD